MKLLSFFISIFRMNKAVGNPNLNAICPECGHNNLIFWLTRVNRIESATINFKCESCYCPLSVNLDIEQNKATIENKRADYFG